MNARFWFTAAALSACMLGGTARAGSTFFFSTGDPDGRIATATRPSSPGKIEVESADDFVLTSHTSLTSATFTGRGNFEYRGRFLRTSSICARDDLAAQLTCAAFAAFGRTGERIIDITSTPQAPD